MLDTVQYINLQQQEQKKAENRMMELLSETNHIVAKQKAAKDIVLPSAGDRETTSSRKGKTPSLNKPNLPAPKTQFSGLKGENDKQPPPGLIAILCEVMVAQARSNSLFWSILYRTATECMQLEVKFAPIMGDAITAAGKAQSKATQAQANQAKESGIINLAGFGASMAIGGVKTYMDKDQAADEDGNLLDKEKSVNLEKETEEDNIEENSQTQDTIQKKTGTWNERRKRGQAWLKNQGKKGSKLIRGFDEGLKTSMGIGMLTQGVTGVFVDKPKLSEKAAQEQYQAQAQALDKIAEQYAQFFGQAFSRSDDLARGAQQNLDYALNILKSSTDSLTSTATSMFRG